MSTDTLSDLDLERQEVEEKIEELRKVEKRTPEQEEELKTLRKTLNDNADMRIKHKHSELLAERNKREQAERELNELKAQRQETTVTRTSTGNINPSILIGTEKFYSNEQLDTLVKAGQMTQPEAQEHYEARRDAQAVSKVRQELQVNQEKQVRWDDMQKVLTEHPKFNPQHPDHNPNDPLFKEADRIYRNGYQSNPRGLSLALEDAKRFLGIKASSRPDRTDDLTVTPSSTPADRTKGTKTELTEKEAELAIQYYCYGSLKNPKTGKSFTKAEALEKALIVKKNKNGGK